MYGQGCCPYFQIRLDVGKHVLSKKEKKVLRAVQNLLDGKEKKPEQENKRQVSSKKKDDQSIKICHKLSIILEEAIDRSGVAEKGEGWKGVKVVEPLDKKSAKSHYNSSIAIHLFHAKNLKVQAESAEKLAHMICKEIPQGENFELVRSVQVSEKGHINFVLHQQQKMEISQNLEIEKDNNWKAMPSEEKKKDDLGEYVSRQKIRFENQQEQVPKFAEEHMEKLPVLEQLLKMEGKKHTLTIDICDSVFNMEEYLLYLRYQKGVHKDPEGKNSERSFSNFLVNSPLLKKPPQKEGDPSVGFGSFHMQYRLDGKLVAVGVGHSLHFLFLMYFPSEPP